MFPFDLSPFGTGLIIMVAVLVILYLVVLVKLNPSTEGKIITKKHVSKQRILEENPTERRIKRTMYDEVKEKTVEPTERQKPVRTAPARIEEIGTQECPHHFGYLREHPKNTPIPNDCLTCDKIMECLSKGE